MLGRAQDFVSAAMTAARWSVGRPDRVSINESKVLGA